MSRLLPTVLIGLFLFQWSCIDEPTRLFIHTGLVKDISAEGVLFAGSIQNSSGSDGIQDYGFVWATTDSPTILDNIVIVGSGSFQGEFEKKIESDLLIGTNYYVKAFVRLTGSIIYGEPIKFKSQGAAGPAILSFSPATGSANSTITIKGARFSQTPNKNIVTVGPFACTVLSAREDELIVKLPGNVSISGKYKITVRIANKIAASETDFMLDGPIPSSVIPSTGLEGTLVTITGTGFSLVPSENLVTFGGVTTPALSSTSEELKVKVPHTNTAGAVSIVITVKGISGSYESFVIEGPAIFTVSPSTGYPGRILTITGKNFSEEPTGNKVLFSNYWNATIVQSSQTELRVIIPFPLSINPGIPMDVSVTVTEKVATVTQVFSALSPWRTSPEFGGEARTAAAGFTIGNTGYVGIGTYSKNCHCYLKDFWSFNPLTNIWQRKADFGGPATGHAFGFAINDKGFVAGGYRNTGNNYEPSAELWSYNPASDAWTKKNNLPAAVSTDYSRVFVISNQAHLLIGTQLYQYDDIADQWINKANYPGIASFYQGLLFTINDKAYVSLDGITLYAYDVNSNVWTRKADFPGLNTVNKSSFAINGKGYAGIGIHYGGDFWLGFEVFQYDPIGDTWTQIPGPPGSIQNSIPLNLNGKVYMVTGDQGDYLAHQTLEFNPEY